MCIRDRCKAQPDYIRQLEALPPRLRDAWLYGKWDVFEGQFFDDFRDDPTPVSYTHLDVYKRQALAN